MYPDTLPFATENAIHQVALQQFPSQRSLGQVRKEHTQSDDPRLSSSAHGPKQQSSPRTTSPVAAVPLPSLPTLLVRATHLFHAPRLLPVARWPCFMLNYGQHERLRASTRRLSVGASRYASGPVPSRRKGDADFSQHAAFERAARAPARSFAELPFRLTFAEERRDALVRVLGHHAVDHDGDGVLVGCLRRLVDLGVEHLLATGDRHG